MFRAHVVTDSLLRYRVKSVDQNFEFLKVRVLLGHIGLVTIAEGVNIGITNVTDLKDDATLGKEGDSCPENNGETESD